MIKYIVMFKFKDIYIGRNKEENIHLVKELLQFRSIPSTSNWQRWWARSASPVLWLIIPSRKNDRKHPSIFCHTFIGGLEISDSI